MHGSILCKVCNVDNRQTAKYFFSVNPVQATPRTPRMTEPDCTEMSPDQLSTHRKITGSERLLQDRSETRQPSRCWGKTILEPRVKSVNRHVDGESYVETANQ